MRGLIGALALILASAAPAEPTRYVTDQLRISLREGPGEGASLFRTLPTGTALTLLDAQAEGDFVRVRDPKGREGWVLRRFLVEQPPARERLLRAQQALETLEGERRRQRESIEGLTRERDEARQTLTERTGALEERIEALRADLQTAKRHYHEARDTRTRRWFMTGAAVLGAGVLLGLLAPLARRRRRTW